MGLFQHKQQDKKPLTKEDSLQIEEHFFDENFREELRNHGRWYFEKVISENGDLFKKDLDATIAQLNIELKERVTSQLDASVAALNVDLKQYVTTQLNDRFLESSKVIKESQDAALAALNTSAQGLQQHYQQLSTTLQKTVADQDALMQQSLHENSSRIDAIRQSQDTALHALTAATESLQQSFQQLSTTVQQSVAAQEGLLVKGFEDNMGQIIEHYLLTAVGDQFDLKSQLPSIIQRMENNKQAILDDIKL
jgi:Tfp pilus assembly protein PilE